MGSAFIFLLSAINVAYAAANPDAWLNWATAVLLFGIGISAAIMENK